MVNQENVLKYIKSRQTPYQLKVGDMVVEMSYSENNKKFNECITNILKRKIEK